jgi:hypothetical protein
MTTNNEKPVAQMSMRDIALARIRQANERGQGFRTTYADLSEKFLSAVEKLHYEGKVQLLRHDDGSINGYWLTDDAGYPHGTKELDAWWNTLEGWEKLDAYNLFIRKARRLQEESR